VPSTFCIPHRSISSGKMETMNRVTSEQANKRDWTNPFLDFMTATQFLLTMYEERQGVTVSFLKRKLQLAAEILGDTERLLQLSSRLRAFAKLGPIGTTRKATNQAMPSL